MTETHQRFGGCTSAADEEGCSSNGLVAKHNQLLQIERYWFRQCAGRSHFQQATVEPFLSDLILLS